ncbi:MAG: hypothetical protein LBK82_04290 [Planctomycetaceae bacterium]|nr:hypothetical protein [Planctomycetaceae bacterium]
MTQPARPFSEGIAYLLTRLPTLWLPTFNENSAEILPQYFILIFGKS